MSDGNLNTDTAELELLESVFFFQDFYLLIKYSERVSVSLKLRAAEGVS